MISDDDFATEFQVLDRQLRMRKAESATRTEATPNLERAAALLMNLPEIWVHLGVDDRQRRDLAREAFEEARLRGHELVSVTPSPSTPRYSPTRRGGRKSL